jgi:molybdopterin/thiamine biosynthesis adenylyltransferase/molybdopterin synthase catalytic subunit/rhodanese-related sulfurtransferase
MFQMTHEPIQPQISQSNMTHRAAGGYVSFEGWVRNQNEGKSVVNLEYEAYEDLAQKEGHVILEEAKRRFEIIDAHCIHRLGTLGLGDLAVWVGVTSVHRAAAFAACEYVVNEVKYRLPIWKKETYTNGDSGWINCQQCAKAESHSTNQSKIQQAKIQEQDYYARQLQLPEIGESGQAKLKACKVLVVGAGGLGSAALQCLAAAGVGTLGICDFDRLEVSNLHRQMLYRTSELGQFKAEAAAQHLRALNPLIQIIPHVVKLTPENTLTLMQAYDWILDGTDNFETKYALNDAAVLAQKPLIHASIYQYEGQIGFYAPPSFNPDSANQSPCFRCLWPESPQLWDLPNCTQSGILGTTASYFGTLQAMQLIQQVLQLSGRLQPNEILMSEMLNHTVNRLQFTRNIGCLTCGENPLLEESTTFSELAEFETNMSLHLDQCSIENLKTFTFIHLGDEPSIVMPESPFKTLHIPYAKLVQNLSQLNVDQPIVLICSTGTRSLFLARRLRQQGYSEIYSLAGGQIAWQAYILQSKHASHAS